jgi:hypothetical protein
MKRICTIAALTLSALLLMASAASAAGTTTVDFANAPSGTHFAGGTSEPTCTVSGTLVTCPAASFQLAGVGNADATEQVTATYSQTIDCRNNGGQVVESHQTTGTASSPPVTLTSGKNGRLAVTPVSVNAPSGGFQPQASCPNPNWTPEARGAPTLTGFTYTLTFAGFTQPAITITG